MDEKKMVELDDSLMDEVSGGIRRPIKTGTNDKAQVRSSPTTAAHNRQDSLVNGTIVDTFGAVPAVWIPQRRKNCSALWSGWQRKTA